MRGKQKRFYKAAMYCSWLRVQAVGDIQTGVGSLKWGRWETATIEQNMFFEIYCGCQLLFKLPLWGYQNSVFRTKSGRVEQRNWKCNDKSECIRWVSWGHREMDRDLNEYHRMVLNTDLVRGLPKETVGEQERFWCKQLSFSYLWAMSGVTRMMSKDFY